SVAQPYCRCRDDSTTRGPRMSDPAEQIYERLLVLRCQAGDEAAFAELVERFAARLHYFVRKLLGHAQSAEDVMQDVWFDVFRSVPRLADPGAISAWLYRIARDRAYRSLRQRRPEQQALTDVDVADSEDDSEFTADNAERIHAGLDELVPEHREVLVLRFLEEMSYDDIARVVEIGRASCRERAC